MTRPDLDGILARADAATPGPWTECGHDRGGCQCRMVRDDDCTVAVAIAHTDESYTLGEGWSVERAKHNATLIAHARTDIPALVAYARELEATLANERGEGKPPVEGWVFGPPSGSVNDAEFVWFRGDVMVWRGPRSVTDGNPTWWWAIGAAVGTEAVTARAAIRAASVPA